MLTQRITKAMCELNPWAQSHLTSRTNTVHPMQAWATEELDLMVSSSSSARTDVSNASSVGAMSCSPRIDALDAASPSAESHALAARAATYLAQCDAYTSEGSVAALRPQSPPMIAAQAIHVPAVANHPLPALVRLHNKANGSCVTAITTSAMSIRLLQSPAHSDGLGVCEAAVGQVCAKVGEAYTDIRLYFERATHWRLAQVRSLEGTCDRYSDPDVYLTIYFRPEQEPWVQAENITAMTLTPPTLPDAEWNMSFLGASRDQPCVYASWGAWGQRPRWHWTTPRCAGGTAPTGTSLRSTSTRLHEHPSKRPVQPPRATPVMLSTLSSESLTHLAYL